MIKSYTYRVGWSKLDKYYYGCRTSNKWPPEEDLWKRYFTSSKRVKQLRLEHGEPDVIEIRRTFDDRDKAARWELRVLQALKVTKNDRYLNQKICKVVTMSAEGRANISKAKRGSKMNEKQRAAMNALGKSWSWAPGLKERNKGKEKSPEHRKKLSEAAKNRVWPKGSRKPLTEEQRKRVSEGLKRAREARLALKENH